MPYIKFNDRRKFLKHINQFGNKIEDAGELNFIISTICGKFLIEKGINYTNYNTVIGAIESAKLEFARMFAPYEDSKIVSNGDLQEYKYIKNSF